MTMDVTNLVTASQSTGTSQTTTTTGSSSDGSTSDFESMIQEQVNSSAGQSGQNSGESTDTNVSTEGETTGTNQEVLDCQRELMAALSAHMVTYRGAEVVETAEVELKMVEAPEEAVELENEFLNLGKQGDGEVSSELGQQMTGETGEEMLESGETFVLEQDLIQETAVLPQEVEVPEEILAETKVVSDEVAVEVEEDLTVKSGTEAVEVTDVSDKVDDGAETVEVVEGQDVKLFQKVEAAPVKVAETVNAEAPDMEENLVKIIEKAVDNGESSVTIQLNPENLGTLTIEITQSANGLLQVVLQTSDDAAKALLGNHINSLAQALQGTGATQVTVEVQEPQDADGKQEMQHDTNPDGRGQQQRQQESDHDEVYAEDFVQQLRLGLVQATQDSE